MVEAIFNSTDMIAGEWIQKGVVGAHFGWIIGRGARDNNSQRHASLFSPQLSLTRTSD